MRIKPDTPDATEVIRQQIETALARGDFSLFMTCRQLAATTNRSYQAVRKELSAGRGPASFKVGGRRLFLRSSVAIWLTEKYCASAPERG